MTTNDSDDSNTALLPQLMMGFAALADAMGLTMVSTTFVMAHDDIRGVDSDIVDGVRVPRPVDMGASSRLYCARLRIKKAIDAWENAAIVCRTFDDDTINFNKYVAGKTNISQFTGVPPNYPPLLTKIHSATRLLKQGYDVIVHVEKQVNEQAKKAF